METGEQKGLLHRIVKFSGNHLKEIAGLITALGITIPLIIAVIQYRQTANQKEDSNFRSIIEKLSNKNMDVRTAAATSMGTFIGKKGKYESEAVAILCNRLLIELDYSVLNAIRGSILNVKNRRKVFENLLLLEHLTLNKDKILRDQLENDSSDLERYSGNQNLKRDSVLYVNSLNHFIQSTQNYHQSSMNNRVLSDFIGTYLQLLSTDSVVSDLRLFQNSLNSCILVGCKLKDCYMSHSAISDARLDSFIIGNSLIESTVFTGSNITRSTLKNNTMRECVFDQTFLVSVSFDSSTFRNVFFIGADLFDVSFRGVNGLNVLNFFMARNLTKAKFDSSFHALLFDSLKTITSSDVINYVRSQSVLLSTRQTEIIEDALRAEIQFKNESKM